MQTLPDLGFIYRIDEPSPDEPFLITASVNLVLAQRLARKICADCKPWGYSVDDIKLGKLVKKRGFRQDVAVGRPVRPLGCHPRGGQQRAALDPRHDEPAAVHGMVDLIASIAEGNCRR